MSFKFKGNHINYHPSWSDFLVSDIKKEIKEIENSIGEESTFTPPSKLVFRFLKFDLEKLKICIIGQDPYPQKAAATGRAFEDERVSCWQKTGKNTSLRNILKLLYKNEKKSEKICNIDTVRKEIKSGKFKILEPKKLFDNWEEQGVLLLNTAFTCEIGSTEVSNSHSKFWACLTRKMVKYIDSKKFDCYWFLWGKQAQEFSCLLSNPNKHYVSNHPSLNSETEGSFFFENTFNKVKTINWINAKK